MLPKIICKLRKINCDSPCMLINVLFTQKVCREISCILAYICVCVCIVQALSIEIHPSNQAYIWYTIYIHPHLVLSQLYYLLYSVHVLRVILSVVLLSKKYTMIKKWYFIKDTFKVVKNILQLLNIVESESSIKSWNRKKCVDKSSWSLSVTTTKKVNI